MQKSRRIAAFTLIELLTVIAIIAILAAILFPVAGAAREQARQGSCMSNLHQIYVAASVYRQDEGAYPPALMGNVEVGDTSGGNCNPLLSTGQLYDGSVPCAANADRLLYGYLYKEQIKDVNLFRCPDNIDRSQRDVTIAHYPPHPPQFGYPWYVGDSGEISKVCPSDAAGYIDCWRRPEVPTTDPRFGRPKYYYIWDSYDIGPRIGPDGKVVLISGQRVYDRHYSTDWTDDPGLQDLTVQLKYQNPPSDRTIIAYCTWHVATVESPNVPAINAAGSARKVNAQDMYKHGATIFNR